MRWRRDVVRRDIRPWLGRERLEDLSRARLLEWRSELVARGATAGVVNAARRVLSAALSAAVEEGLLQANACRGIRPLPTRRPDRRPIPVGEVERIRAAMPTARDRLIVSLLAYGGLRPGEVLGLRWMDVQGHTLHVHQALGEAGMKRTKSGATRTVMIRPAVADDLAVLERGSGLVVRSPGGGPVVWRSWVRGVWGQARGPDADWVPYEGRHTCASLLIASRMDIMQVQAWLGHASARMTLDAYAHLLAEASYAEAIDIDHLVGTARQRAEAAA